MALELKPLGPIAYRYYTDDSRVACIVGPVGSAKSTASCLRLARHALQQKVGPDGVRRSRFGIVRNTKRQLRDTTIKTWQQLFPEDIYGQFYRGDDLRHVWRVKGEDGVPVEAEFMFRALDDEADVANLLSLEVTGFYFNEVREISEAIITHAGRRAGRFPAVHDGGCTWSGWISDSNPWDVEHFLHDRFVESPREGWVLFRQPSGLAPDAENVENLQPGYYENALKDYSPEDARVYVHAEWGRTRAGKPIYTDYNDLTHCRPFELSPVLPLRIGMDFGRTPAATIGTRSATGQWKIRHELVTEDMGLVRFGELVASFVRDRYPGWPIASITGDPAGEARDANDKTAFDILAGAGLRAEPAQTNDPSLRIESVNKAFRTMEQGEPALLIHPECKVLRRACIDGYRYRKLKTSDERYDDKPDKNKWSHVAEALQYMLVGGGDARALVKRHNLGARPPQYAQRDYAEFGS